jgi:hypothetical protein
MRLWNFNSCSQTAGRQDHFAVITALKNAIVFLQIGIDKIDMLSETD